MPLSYEPEAEASNPGTQYALLESVSFAFLLALEALTPTQRAVLLLREVFDYSVSETAEALGLSESNVKTTHHRARRTMRAYDRERRPPTRVLQAQTRQALERFVTCLFNADVAGAEALLADDAQHFSDGGGEFAAARGPILGLRNIVRLYMHLMQQFGHGLRSEIRLCNGLPAFVTENSTTGPRYAPRFVTGCDLDADGRIKLLYIVLASRKLTAIRAA